MMIFQHTWQKVLNGSKTQTRRVVKDGEWAEGRYEWDGIKTESSGMCNGLAVPAPDLVEVLEVISESGRIKWGVGKTYAVQPGRTQKAIARIKVTGLRQEEAAWISAEDAIAEGFDSRGDFFATWLKMHPTVNMQCWVIEFELVQ